MRKLLFFSLLFFLTIVFAFAESIDIDEVRMLYEKSATDEKANKKMLSILSAVNEESPLLLGYKASGTMMMAKYVFSPFSKLSYFNKGKRMLESAIEVDEENVELRFLRFMIQANSPSFLGYSNDIELDKRFTLENIGYLKDVEAKKFIFRILDESKHLDSDEKVLLNIERLNIQSGKRF